MTTLTRDGLFDHVLCGVDHSEAGVAAARAAAVVAHPSGSLTLLTANDRSAAVHGGYAIADLLSRLDLEAEAALEHGKEAVRPVREADSKLVEGSPSDTLLDEIERSAATLVVVGSHDTSRGVGIALGSVATHLLHGSPCPVLVVRGDVDPESWPRRIVVGVDGSEDSRRAYDAARTLASRRGSTLRAVVATEDSRVDVEAARQIAPDVEEHEARALDALNVLSEGADLVVVGSRGLRGLRALGSLSERLAHEARSSVLVVRGPA